MACLDNETATAYLRGDLEPEEADRWAAHLADCDACQRLVRQVSELMDSVRQDLMLAYTLPVSPSGASARRLETLMRTRAPRHWVRPGLTWLRPGYAGAGLAAAIALVLFVIGWRETPISAAEALERATVSERALASDVTHIVPRTLAIEERRTGDAAVSRRRVEIWQNAAQGTKVRRLYDAGGRLVAGEWTRPDGSRAIYQPDAAPVIEAAGTPVPLDVVHAWRWEPSVQALTDRRRKERVTLERGSDPRTGSPFA
jgi:anti-sigma factor RsiW